MEPVIFIIAGIYCMAVGLHGNAMALFAQVEEESTFLYWIVAILIVTALWETPKGATVARPFAVLIILGWMVATNATSGQRNYAMVLTGLKTLLPEI